MADAHPLGARPFGRKEYVSKFRSLAEGVIASSEQDRFLGVVDRLTTLKPDDLLGLTFSVDPASLGAPAQPGLFDWRAPAAPSLSIVSG